MWLNAHRECLSTEVSVLHAIRAEDRSIELKDGWSAIAIALMPLDRRLVCYGLAIQILRLARKMKLASIRHKWVADWT